MYKIKKQAKRTPKQIFALIKDKLLELARNQPKAKVTQLSYQKIIFPKPLKFSNANVEELSEPSVSLNNLKEHSSTKYEFYLQNYDISISDELLSLLQPKCLLSFSDKVKHGKLNCISASQSGVVVVGTDTGTVIVASDLLNKKYQLLQVFDQPIVAIDINESNLVCSDSTGRFAYFELVNSEMKKVCQFKSTPALSIKPLRYKDQQLILICDTEGGISRAKIKNWTVMYRSEVKLLIKQKSFFHLLRVLDRNLQSRHLNKHEHAKIIIFGVINSRSAILFGYDPDNDKLDKLYTLSNLNSHVEKGTNSLEFLFGPLANGNENLLIVACGFDDRLYFVRVGESESEVVLEDHIELRSKLQFYPSKRMKCSNSIASVNFLGAGLFTILTKTGYIYYCHTSNIIFMEKFTNIGELKKLSVNCNQDLHNLYVSDTINNVKNVYLYSASVCTVKGNLLIIMQNELVFCEILNSMSLYKRFSMTENVLLLYLLLLFRYSESVYLKPPESFESLQLEFPKSCPEVKQILLEYYYLMKMEPPDDLANPDELNELLLPFILKHQLNNLSDDQSDSLVKYWEKTNYLVIEEIIVSGVNKGWDIAIKNAWMRSLVKMVQMGAEYDFPVLKLYGYVVLYRDKDSALMEKYAVMIVNYILLGISRKLKPQVEHDEYKSMIELFVRILFDKDLFVVLATVKPKKALSMIAELLSGDSKKCVDDMGLCPFVLNCNRKYEGLVMIEGSVSEILYSHTSETICQMFAENKEVQNCMVLQQALLIHKWEFRFTEDRMFQIISCILSSDEIFDKLKSNPMFDGKVKEELELAAQQFIIDLIDNMESNYCLKDEHKWAFVELADKSSSFDYVVINLLSSTKKFESIFAKFLASRNSLIREKIFDWMANTMERCRMNPDPKPLEEFNRVSLSKVRFYMQINKQKTKAFVQQYYKNSEKKLISKIEQYPQLQLEYVELIIQDSTEEVEEYILNLHISLLCRLNPSRVIPVLEEASTHEFVKYNLKEALELCNQHNLTEAVIYINEKVGEVHMSLGRHLEVFADEWEKYKKDTRDMNVIVPRRTITLNEFRSLMNKPKPPHVADELAHDSQQVLYDHLDYILDLIHRQPKLPSYYELYGLLVNFFMKIYTMEEEQARSVVNKGDETFLNKVSDLIGVLILDLAKQGNVDYLVDEVIDKYVGMDFREMRKHFYRTYKVLQGTLTMLKNVSEISKQHLLKFNLSTREEMINSIASESHCRLCGGILTEDSQSLLFRCGHLFHMQCTVSQDGSDYCAQCVFADPIGAMVDEPELNLNQFLRDRMQKLKSQRQSQQQIEQKEVQVKKMTANQKRLNKMKIYDKRQQELIVEAETVELRLELRETVD